MMEALRIKADRINTRPTEGQKHAGNYKKGHVRVLGLDVTLENPKGSTRSGMSADGKKWSSVLPNHYGYIKRTLGADGDHVDCYIGDDVKSKMIYVIDQKDHKSGKFDEHKCMIGFGSYGDALRAYRAAFTDGKDRVMTVTIMTLKQFKEWLRSKKPQQKTRKHWSHDIYRS